MGDRCETEQISGLGEGGSIKNDVYDFSFEILFDRFFV